MRRTADKLDRPSCTAGRSEFGPRPFSFRCGPGFRIRQSCLTEPKKILAAWTKRRQEAVEASSCTFQAICGCKDADAMTTAYAEWLTNSMNRIPAM
jgi:hypothetical protein